MGDVVCIRGRHCDASNCFISGRKSSAVTAPCVAALMLTSTSVSGNLRPAAYRLTAPPDTPTWRPKSATVMPLVARYSDNRMDASVTKTATARQASCCQLGNRRPEGHAGNLPGMATPAKKNQVLFVAEWLNKDGRSDAEIAGELGVRRETVWRWRNGERGLKDSEKPRLAAVLGIEPDAFYRHPDRPSLDDLMRGQDNDIVQQAAEMLEIFIRNTTAKKTNKSA
jgi:transcriptional regulator with XRE-family HTH domain